MEVLYRNRGIAIIDGDNIVDLLKDHGIQDHSSIKPVEDVIFLLYNYGISQEQLFIFFDAKIPYQIPTVEQDRLTYGINKKLYQILPFTVNWYDFFIMLAESSERRFIIISNDTFQTLPSWFQDHRIGVGLRNNKHISLSIKSRAELDQLTLGKFSGEVSDFAD